MSQGRSIESAGGAPAAGAGEETAVARPHGALWLWYLYFRPRVFFEHFGLNPSPLFLAVCAWTYGMAGVTMRKPVAADWTGYWLFVAIVGAVAGLVYFIVGGFWFCLRIGFSGAFRPDPRMARRVYLLSAQVESLPLLAVAAFGALRHHAPADAHAGGWGWETVLLWCGLALWGTGVAYVGVCRAFDVNRRRALAWIVALPGALYLTIAVAAIDEAVRARSREPLTDVSSLNHHVGEHIQFSYPGTWRKPTDFEGYDPDGMVMVISPSGDAAFVIQVYGSADPLEEVLLAVIDGFRAEHPDLREEGEFSQWGRFAGKGRILRMQGGDGSEMVMRLFVSPLPHDGRLEVRELAVPEREPHAEKGFEVIRSSFAIRG